MANIKLFEPYIIRNEGYYSNDPDDTGGETWEGISRNNFPKWGGWLIIDAYKAHSNFPSVLKGLSDLQQLVDNFYKFSEWDVLKADQINNQSIANFLVDWEINGGLGSPCEHAQAILGIKPVYPNMGPKTLAGINTNSNQDFFNKLQAARKQFYLDVVKAHPSDQKFLQGWLNRTASFSFVA